MNRTEDIDKQISRDALKLIAAGVGLGFLIGLAVGLYIGSSQGNRITVIPLTEGVRT